MIEGCETSTKTGFLSVPKEIMYESGVGGNIELPVTHAKIFGWYDNEFGSYVTTLCHTVKHIDENLKNRK